MVYRNREIQQINIRRRRYWIINALLKIALKLNFYRDKRLWVYGAWEGKRYDDNSRYLFEHVSDNHPEIKSIWLSPRKDVVDLVRKHGYAAEYSYSLIGICTQLKAGVFFFSNGLEDIGDIALIQGAKIIGLWHGTGMKNVYYLQAGQKKGIISRIKEVKDRIFSVIYQDYTIATSEEVAKMRQQTYHLKPNQILITGQPRNDILKRHLIPSDVLTNLKNLDSNRFLLFMPTYRPYENTIIEDFVAELSNNKGFTRFLIDNNVVFLLKLHYLTKIEKSIVRFPYIILSNEDVASTQELLVISECLITDYSGCCVDFSLKNMPILLYAPDFEEYCLKQGIKSEWFELYREYSCKTIPEIMEAIKYAIRYPQQNELCTRINELYEDESLKGTTYSENVYCAIKNLILNRKGE